jgi:hypothetical protein
LEKMCQNMVLIAKALASNMHQNFSRNVCETGQHILRNLQYDGTIACCSNWLMKLIHRLKWLAMTDAYSTAVLLLTY